MEPTFTQKVEATAPLQQSSNFTYKPVDFTWKKILTILGVVLAVLIMWQWISSPMVVTVTGTGKASVPATSATVTATVSVNSDSAQNAINSAAAKADAIKPVLKTRGVPESNISESQVTTYPAGLVMAGATGYQAAIQVSAKTNHVSTLGDLVAKLYSAGATLVAQPVLSVENQTALETAASDAAVKDAKTQIGKIALKNLKPFRKIVYLAEDSGVTTSTTTSKADTVTQAQNQLAAQNGVFEIVKVVSVSYKLW
jgi:uncharacterized protein YggE